MKGTIELIGMEFHSFHGCLPSEREQGARYLVDFLCEYPFGDAAQNDCLEDTLDYSAIYDIVAAQMAQPSNLLENVAWRIAQAIRKAFPDIPSFKVSVAKENPPVGGPAAWAKVSVEI